MTSNAHNQKCIKLVPASDNVQDDNDVMLDRPNDAYVSTVKLVNDVKVEYKEDADTQLDNIKIKEELDIKIDEPDDINFSKLPDFSNAIQPSDPLQPIDGHTCVATGELINEVKVEYNDIPVEEVYIETKEYTDGTPNSETDPFNDVAADVSLHERIPNEDNSSTGDAANIGCNSSSGINDCTKTGEDKRFYECDVCGVYEMKFQHGQIHAGEKPYVCDTCVTGSINRNEQFVKGTNTGVKSFVCDMCDKEFNRNEHLLKHKRIHTGEKPYECDVCKKVFNQKENYLRHKKIHTGEKPYECELCKKRFTRNDQLISHTRLHTGVKPYVCDVCDKRFNRNLHLVNHKRVHTGEMPYECEVCNKRFTRNDQLVIHKRLHTGEKPYECEFCNKQFNRSVHLVHHKRTHTGEMPYECDVCNKSFIRKDQLVNHRRIHTGEKPYACKVCGKQFNRTAHLVKHKRLHTGEKPYACEVCKKRYTRNEQLARHKKRQHT